MRGVVILSGGLDSAVSLGVARSRRIRLRLALFFDYGQRARAPERRASRALARHYRVPWKEVRLPWLAKVTKTGLVRGTIPSVSEADLDDPTRSRRTAGRVWVPNRNGVFLNIAAAFAESLGAGLIVTGFDREEARTFPDNSVEYLHAVNRAFRFSTSNGVRVRSFVAGLNKTGIVARGLQRKVPLHLTWSCYKGGKRPCGRCESCARARRAFRKNDALDCWPGPKK